MDVEKLLVFIIFLLLCKVDATLSETCDRLTETSGTITAAMYGSKCWKIIVPSNTYVFLNMDSFTSNIDEDCSLINVEVSMANRNEKYTFCLDESNWKPIIAFNDITVKLYNEQEMINDYGDFDIQFSMTYRRENIMCMQRNIFKCSDGACIPQSQVCDGIKQCQNGNDEKSCETGVFAVSGVDSSRMKIIHWLKERWSPTSGWQSNTHRAIIALNLATERKASDIGMEEVLMVKQLEAQILASLLRDETDPLSPNQLSMFINALIASCQNPYNVYGYNLVKLLKEKLENSSSSTHPVPYMTLCIAGETLSVNATNDVIKVLSSDLKYPFLLDIQAAAVIALSCTPTNQPGGYNSSLVNAVFEKTVTRFKKIQAEDGSFGNVYTTAIVTQALIAAGEVNSKDWKLKAAVNHLMKHLNSSTIDILAAYLILPILNGKSLVEIGILDCWDGEPPKLQGDSLPEVKSKLGPKMRVQYSLYIGDEKDVVHTLSLRVPENITVYEIMQIAEEADTKYKFQWKYMGEKLYIYDLAGITNDLEDGLFWLLYVGKDVDSINHNTKSPDKIIVHDGAQIIMWYKKAQI